MVRRLRNRTRPISLDGSPIIPDIVKAGAEAVLQEFIDRYEDNKGFDGIEEARRLIQELER